MLKTKLTDNIYFDFEKAMEVADNYSRATSKNCMIIDKNGETVYKTDSTKLCTLCKKLETALDDQAFCKKYKIYNAHQANRFGGKYIFLCPMGLVNWISPITIDGITIGSFISGSYALIPPEKKLFEKVLDKLYLPKDKSEELFNNLVDTEKINPDTITGLSEMLFLMSCHVSDISHYSHVNSQKHLTQLSVFNDYIQQLKSDDSKVQNHYSIEKENELIKLAKAGNKSDCQKLIIEIISSMYCNKNIDFKTIKTRVLEILVILSRAVLESGTDTDTIFDLNNKYIWEITELKNINKLIEYINDFFDNFFEFINSYDNIKHIDAIYQSIRYLNANYMNPLSLEDLAHEVHLSPSYVSRIFTEELNMTFKGYLNKIRIEKSKELLLENRISVAEVSYLVGFNDQSYFSKVFKNLTGVTPKKFQSSLGRFVPDSEVNQM
ncbi:AraC-type DNA-binding protein [Dethiosulfatibacter aminovorans DSM 17477]|uniref:AraC-type DNA-binding protein n=1 Tax=Dethiosulfatibacter aminovorans DSM 17477 TaxID=1121476 RepID=A0A1M6KWR7_9FIRM|nr:helix-turn-helix domain-containing protein [Dethiosulfatibacter aminovorans]SHJ63326.1 AraC-type DNA-binding protein [Dethiosulfatibacter aminovorans DSM 17477]